MNSGSSGAAAPSLFTLNFTFFWVAQAVSKAGDPITLVGLAAITYQLTGSALYTSVAVLVATLPQATFGFFAGPIADALGSRRAMIATDIARAALIGAIPLVLQAGAALWVVYMLVLVAGLCSAIFGPARVSMIPALLTPGQLVSGNAAVYATDRTVEILGAVAGGLLVASIGVQVFYVDALTFALSALLLLRVRVAEPQMRRVTWGGAARDARAGLRVIKDSSLLLANTSLSVLAQLSIPLFNGLLPVLVFRRFGTNQPDLGASFFGFAEASIAMGAVVGSLLLPRVSRSVTKGKLVVWGFVAFGASFVVAASAPTFEVLLVTLLVTGITNVFFYVPNMAIVQERAPTDVRGAVIGARISLVSLSWLPIVLLGGALADLVDVSLLIAVAGAFTVAVALVGSRLRVLTDVP